MKKLLVLLILFVSSTGYGSLFSSSLFGQLGQCGTPSMDSMLLPLMMMQQMAPSTDPVEELENEIDDLKDRAKDLKSDIRSARRASEAAERKAQRVEERMAELGCTGVIADSPLACIGLRSRQRRLQAQADMALTDIDAMKDEIEDIRDEIKDLRSERSNAEKRKQEQDLQKSMQMKMLADLMSSSSTQQQRQRPAATPTIRPAIANQPQGPAGFSSGSQVQAVSTNQRPATQQLQASCPHCNVPAFTGTSPNAGIASLSSQLSPVLENQIRERNRQLGWPETPSLPSQPVPSAPVPSIPIFPRPPIAQPSYPFIMPPTVPQTPPPPFLGYGSLAFGMNPIDPFGINCFPSSTGPQFGGAYGGVPVAGGMFPGGAISPVSTPFNSLPPVPVAGVQPMTGGLSPIPVRGVQ